MVPTAGTSDTRAIPHTIDGEDYCDVDMANYKSFLVDIHALSLEQV